VEGSWQDDETDRALRRPACDDFYILGGSWNSWPMLFFMVLNAVVDGRAQDALFMCVLHEQNENRYLLWFFTYLLLCFVVVLLLNMLIAMFSRSFDMMYDAMTIHVQTNFARVVVAWCASSPEPPPLNLLQVPYKAVLLVLSWLRRLRTLFGGRRSARQASRSDSTSSETSAVVQEPAAAEASSSWAADAKKAAASADTPSAASAPASPATGTGNCGAVAADDERLGQMLRGTHGTFAGMGLQPAVLWLLHNGRQEPRNYAGTTVKSVEGTRNSWEIWKEKQSEAELAHEVSDFAAKREDTLAQEDRWRNKMLRNIGDKFTHVDKRFDRMNERFDQLAAACAELTASVRALQPQQAPVEVVANAHL